MQFVSVSTVSRPKHISLYEGRYINRAGNEKVYEFVSRKHEISSLEDIQDQRCDGVVIAAFDEGFSHILLEREFRPAVGDFVYNFPAGLIDPGESASEAGARELREETGLEIVDILDSLSPAYALSGLSNELSQLMICTVRGEFGGEPEENEEIEANWYSKAAVRRLLATAKFSARAQLLCWLWTSGAEVFHI